jgi:large subunit ribosomal protein L18
MKSNTLQKNARRKRRRNHVRRAISKRSDLPRLSVSRSSKHIAAQIIDDVAGRTLAAVSSTGKAFAAELAGKTKTQRAAVIGGEIAKRAADAGVQTVVFDRGFNKYHGRVKALADAAREAGLKF